MHFSEKQNQVIRWWGKNSPTGKCRAIICDGAIRSGKTLSCAFSFALWCLLVMRGGDFAVCGKSAGAVRRNILPSLLPLLKQIGVSCEEVMSQNMLKLTLYGRTATWYIFGGKDEAAHAYVQGITLQGALFDEAALLPKNFINMVTSRCSNADYRLFFSCNPENPGNWFYNEWIKPALPNSTQLNRHKACYLHFVLEDNPVLTPERIAQYKTEYEGAFYKRYVLGEWCAPDGLVYPQFAYHTHVVPAEETRAGLEGTCPQYAMSCDYGTMNPCSVGLWGQTTAGWVRLKEYYYDARRSGIPRTDEQHYAEIEALAGSLPVKYIYIDPTAKSLISCILFHGKFIPIAAESSVLEGIQLTAEALRQKQLLFSSACEDCIREFGLYTWENDPTMDRPKKEFDHSMDDVRYFAQAMLRPAAPETFFCAAIPRSGNAIRAS